MNAPSPISSQDREAISQLQFFARGVVEGLTAGKHRSPLKGSSIEFKEHREYVRGDEIKSIDWKLFGKTDRLFIRQYEDETNLRSMVLLDQSGSMGYRGRRSNRSKHEFAVQLAACFATLLICQHDSVGLATLDTKLQTTIPPRSTPNQLQKIFATLVASKPGGETSLGEALQEASSKLKRRGLLVLISDCFDKVENLVPALNYFRHRGNEVVVFQVWDPDELEFPFRNRTEFRSLERTGQRLVDPNALRKSYLKRVAEFRSQLETETAKSRIDFLACTSNQNCGQVLREFISHRQGKPLQGVANVTGGGSK